MTWEDVVSDLAGDRWRRYAVTLCMVYALVGGVYATSQLRLVNLARSSVLGAPGTLTAMATGAHVAWLVVLGGLCAFTAWQWVPSRVNSVRFVVAGPWMMMAQLTLFLISIHSGGQTNDAVEVMQVALAIVVCRAFVVLETTPATSRFERWTLDVPMGFATGFASVAGVTSIAGFVERLATARGDWSDLFAIIVALVTIMILLMVGMGLAALLEGRFSVSMGVVWGLAGMIWARILGDPKNVLIAVCAGLAAILVLMASVTIVARRRTTPTNITFTDQLPTQWSEMNSM